MMRAVTGGMPECATSCWRGIRVPMHTGRALLAPMLLVPMLLAALACRSDASPEGPAGEPAVRDSAGVRIVEHPGALGDAPIEVTLVWEHGRRPDDYPFNTVFFGALQPDGGAVIGDVGNREVPWFGPDGSSRGLLAPRGQGPAEVGTPVSVLVSGQDSVWIDDQGNVRLARFERGTLAETIPGRLTDRMSLMGLAPDGTLLLHTSRYMSRFPQPWLDGHVARFDPVAGTLDTIASYPMAPHRPETGIPLFVDGYGVVTGAGEGYIQARTDLAEVVWRAPTGAVTQVVRWRPEPRYADQEMWDLFEENLRASLTRVNPGMPSERLDEFLDQQVASYTLDVTTPLPAFSQLVRGNASGEVWLPDFTPPGRDATGYHVLAADGTSFGRAVFPRPIRVVAVTENLVLGTHTDEIGVVSAGVYRWSRPTR